jgi:hypothetical protein
VHSSIHVESRYRFTAAKSTTGSRAVVLAVRHVAAATCETRKVNAGVTAMVMARARRLLRDRGLRRPREK